MSLFWIKSIILIFAIHVCVFSVLYIRKRKTRHLIVALNFVLLILSFSCRLWATDITVFGYDLHLILRIAAWISTTILVAQLVRRRFVAKGQ
ncbi:MAG: hypothetical protein CSA21_04865 [Deltaproteobacteria bacterium]|nr:MAG: hypothetical protein CSA21_04865 [Deltaproteobacteria bacterium]